MAEWLTRCPAKAFPTGAQVRILPSALFFECISVKLREQVREVAPLGDGDSGDERHKADDQVHYVWRALLNAKITRELAVGSMAEQAPEERVNGKEEDEDGLEDVHDEVGCRVGSGVFLHLVKKMD